MPYGFLYSPPLKAHLLVDRFHRGTLMENRPWFGQYSMELTQDLYKFRKSALTNESQVWNNSSHTPCSPP